MNDWLFLALGVAGAGLGGELFVRGAVGVARWMRISPGIIGAAQFVLGERRAWLAFMSSTGGLLLLVASASLIVVGAKGIALSAGIDEFVIGATVVAIGTSTPELATAIVSKLRGHDEVGVGTILGSNIFNGLFIIPIAAAIFPIAIPLRKAAGALIFGWLAVALIFPRSDGCIGRGRGMLLLGLFGAYLFAVLGAGA